MSTSSGFSRRGFLAASTATVAANLLAPAATLAAAAPAPVPTRRRSIQLAVSSYSHWHMHGPKVPIETVIEKTAALGVPAVDILHRQMNLPERAPLSAEHRTYLRNLKRHAFRQGVSLVCLSIHQDFVDPSAEFRQKEVEHTIKCIEIAAALGISCVRLSSGRWNTTPNFTELMKLRGEEPVLPGHTEDEGFQWCQDAIEQCLPKAAECGVMLALENHWGLTRKPEGLLRLVNGIKSPWLGALMDTGNFLEEPYPQLVQIAPKAVFVQAKTYYGGGEWYTLDIDYKRVAQILADANYSGYVSLEMEGKEHADTAVPKSIAMLREAFGV
jgi:sugar phosphate isomerase/epimerase